MITVVPDNIKSNAGASPYDADYIKIVFDVTMRISEPIIFELNDHMLAANK